MKWNVRGGHVLFKDDAKGRLRLSYEPYFPKSPQFWPINSSSLRNFFRPTNQGHDNKAKLGSTNSLLSTAIDKIRESFIQKHWEVDISSAVSSAVSLDKSCVDRILRPSLWFHLISLGLACCNLNLCFVDHLRLCVSTITHKVLLHCLYQCFVPQSLLHTLRVIVSQVLWAPWKSLRPECPS